MSGFLNWPAEQLSMNDWNDSIFGGDVEGDLLDTVADDDDDGFDSDFFSADILGLVGLAAETVLESTVDNGTSVVKGLLVMAFTAILLFSAVE